MLAFDGMAVAAAGPYAPFDGAAYWRVVTRSATPAAGAPASCAPELATSQHSTKLKHFEWVVRAVRRRGLLAGHPQPEHQLRASIVRCDTKPNLLFNMFVAPRVWSRRVLASLCLNRGDV